MRWLRSRIRPGTWLALLALAIQLALSFGHLHLHGSQRSAPVSLVVQWIVQPASAAPDAPADPTQEKPGLPGHACAVCSVMQLAKSAVPPVAPVLSLPDARAENPFGANPDSAAAASPRLVFHARAPPQA